MKKSLLHIFFVLLFIGVLICNEFSSNISDKTWSISAGLGTNRSFSFLGLSKDFRINNNFSCFISTGIGKTIIGTGLSFQNNYNNNGFNIALNYGLQLISGDYYDHITTEDRQHYIWHSVANYQWKIGKQIFLSTGIMVGWFYSENVAFSFGGAIQNSEKTEYALPTISLDYRF